MHCNIGLCDPPTPQSADGGSVPSSNPLNDDAPMNENSFAADYNVSATLYADALELYENAIERFNNVTMLADELVRQIQTGTLILENATIIGISVLSAPPPVPPTPPVIPPQFENISRNVNVSLVIVEEPPSPPQGSDEGGDEEGEVLFSIPVQLVVSLEPHAQV